jgi:hypothetical protein
MSSKFSRWIRSKAGLASIAGLVVVLVLVGIIGQQLEWWDLNLSGAAGVAITLPPVQYPDPQGGYTCLPTCAMTNGNPEDGKFLLISNLGAETFASEKVVVWVGVPGNKASFELGIFDGDSGKDSTGKVNFTAGNWDDGITEVVYTLYADPLKDGKGTTVVKTWRGNTDAMPNNDWFNQIVDNVEAAKAPSRHYFYRLEVVQAVVGRGGNAFRLRSNGYLATGRSDLVNASIGFIGQMASMKDLPILYPQSKSLTDLGSVGIYNGEWKFYIYQPKDSKTLTIWDGDFDRGTDVLEPTADTHDPNSPAKPAWAGPATKNEGVGGKGNPNDDNIKAYYKVSPAVMYNLISPNGTVYANDNPSGTEEWEKFELSTDASVNPDYKVDQIKAGFYMLQVVGLDLHNLAFLRTDLEVCDPINGCGPCIWPGCNAAACPRTIGYWKNNIKKVYIQNRTSGVQESKETLDWALKAVALQSPIYRAGLVASLTDAAATKVASIADAIPLTPEEANTILQKGTTLGDSMLGRALQQNLALWLNLASGKISDNAVVTINVPSGTFEGTLMEAMFETQTIMLNGGNIERAKDIADIINNGKINVDPDSNVDASGNKVCTMYTIVIPEDEQPENQNNLPEAPNPRDMPPANTDANTCSCPCADTSAKSTQYKVENTTTDPFYGIKFTYVSGMEIKGSNFDDFDYVLTKAEVAAMTSMQIHAKAGKDEATVTLDSCQFTEELPCAPVQTKDHLFAFSFMGAINNGNDTFTLTFQIQNYATAGLNQVTFGLPAGVVPSSPATGNYETVPVK